MNQRVLKVRLREEMWPEDIKFILSKYRVRGQLMQLGFDADYILKITGEDLNGVIIELKKIADVKYPEWKNI